MNFADVQLGERYRDEFTGFEGHANRPCRLSERAAVGAARSWQRDTVARGAVDRRRAGQAGQRRRRHLARRALTAHARVGDVSVCRIVSITPGTGGVDVSMREIVEGRIRQLHRHADGQEHEHTLSEHDVHEHIGVLDGVPFSSGRVTFTALDLLVDVDAQVGNTGCLA